MIVDQTPFKHTGSIRTVEFRRMSWTEADPDVGVCGSGIVDGEDVWMKLNMLDGLFMLADVQQGLEHLGIFHCMPAGDEGRGYKCILTAHPTRACADVETIKPMLQLSRTVEEIVYMETRILNVSEQESGVHSLLVHTLGPTGGFTVSIIPPDKIGSFVWQLIQIPRGYPIVINYSELK